VTGPGQVNLIGEHTSSTMAEWFCLPPVPSADRNLLEPRGDNRLIISGTDG
jgi:hypothetical protein